MIQTMQALMTEWCGCICAIGALIAPAKTRWFMLSFFWNGNDWEYRTKDSLSDYIMFPDKEGNLYSVSREEPTAAFESLGLRINLANISPNALDNITLIYPEYSTQMNNAKCNKTSF